MKRKKIRRKAREKENHKSSKVRKLLNKVFSLSTKRVLVILAVWVLSVVTHLIIELVFDFDEKIFFLISGIILPLYLLISILFFTRNCRKEE